MATKKRSKKAQRAQRPRKWSAEVMRKSDALDLEQDVFKSELRKAFGREP